jgi:5-methylcytosine-specific restriction endonuclease McrA
MSTLVLNSSWLPIKIEDRLSAICTLYRGKAKALDKNFTLHDWDSWVTSWKDAELLARDVVRSATLSVVVPRVIVLTDYKKYTRKRIGLTRKNIYKRDDCRCQYCGKKSNVYSDYNIDHVIPSSKGGKTVWTNCVLSCLKCNCSKGSKTLKEAGMKLLRKPFIPQWHHLSQDVIAKHHDDWHTLLDEMYWEIELTD